MKVHKFKVWTENLGFSEPFGLGEMPNWGPSAMMTVWTLGDPRVKVVEWTGRVDASGVEIYEGHLIGNEFNKVEWSGDSWCINGDTPLYVVCGKQRIVGHSFEK